MPRATLRGADRDSGWQSGMGLLHFTLWRNGFQSESSQLANLDLQEMRSSSRTFVLIDLSRELEFDDYCCSRTIGDMDAQSVSLFPFACLLRRFNPWDKPRDFFEIKAGRNLEIIRLQTIDNVNKSSVVRRFRWSSNFNYHPNERWNRERDAWRPLKRWKSE
jgi:hypothetical protein